MQAFFTVFLLGHACLRRAIEDADFALMTEEDAKYIFLLDGGEYVTVAGLSKATDFLKKTENAEMLAPGLSRRILNRGDALRLLFYLSDLS